MRRGDLSGYSDRVFAEQTWLFSEEAFLDKPCTPTELLQAVSLAITGAFTAAQAAEFDRSALALRGLRNPQDLTRFDLVRVRQQSLVGVENVHVSVGIAEFFPGDLAERVAGLHGVGTFRGA